MDPSVLFQHGVQALLQLAVHPFYYLAILFVWFVFSRQVAVQRKQFHSRMFSAAAIAGQSAAWGAAAGLAVSAVMAAAGTDISTTVVMGIWILTLLFSLFNVKLACLAYAAGVAGILHMLLDWFPGWRSIPFLQPVFGPFSELHPGSLLLLIGLLHLCEAAFARLRGKRFASPQIFESARGRLIGGYVLQGYWPVPLFLLVPAPSGALSLSWEPLFFAGNDSGGWSLLVFPALIGYSELVLDRLPEEKIRESSIWGLAYGILLMACAASSLLAENLAFAGFLLCIVGHEWIGRLKGKQKEKRGFLFAPDKRGLKVLAVIPGTPAVQMGILPGEIVHKVNGIPVHTRTEFHDALRSNPAFCRLEVLNLQGESKFLQRALFSGQHHQLGLLFVPEEKDRNAVEYRVLSLPGLFGGRLKRSASAEADREQPSAENRM